MLMEHSTSGVNWHGRNIAKQPGEMARNSLAHVGRGADAVMFFQWRASRKGAEKFHSAMVPHAGTDSRIWQEVSELGATLDGLADLRGARVAADVAILWDWESHWAQDLPWRPADDLSHRAQIQTWYERLWRDHVTTDFAHPEDDLSGYRLVLDGHTLRSRLWCEDLQLRGAEEIGSYAEGPLLHGTAATRHSYYAGTAWYVASDLDVQDLSVLFSEPYAAADLALRDLPEDVELLERTGEDDTRHLIAINHTGDDLTLSAGDHRLEITAGGIATARIP